jgi:peptidoglycan/LPS O-acetylase OafA/YrhL
MAAIAVVLYHFAYLFVHGYLAVDFFFCLSGFVLAYVYEARFRDGLRFLDFAAARLIRLYPMVAIGGVLGLGLFLLLTPDKAALLFAALGFHLLLIPHVMLDGPSPPDIFPLNIPFWSLFYELVVSLAWGLLLRHLPPLRLFALLLIFAVPALWLAGYPSFNALAHLNGTGWALLRTLLGFSAGLVAFELFKRGLTARWKPGLALPALMLMLTFLMPQQLGIWFDFACTAVWFPLITLVGAAVVTGDRFQKLCDWLGRLSYPLYGVHYPIMLVLSLPVFAGFKNDYVPLWALSGLAIAIAVAAVVALYEPAIRSWLTNLWRRNRTAGPATLAPHPLPDQPAAVAE